MKQSPTSIKTAEFAAEQVFAELEELIRSKERRDAAE